MNNNELLPIDKVTALNITSLAREDRVVQQEWLAEVARLHHSSAVRRSAMVALREIGSPLVRTISLLILTHETKNENLRETAIKCLGEVGTKEDLELLKELNNNEQIARFGKQAAAKALARLSKKLESVENISDTKQQTQPIDNSETQPYFDVAISFAGEDRATAEALAHRFRDKSLRVFYDMYYQSDLIGEDLAHLLAKIYGQASLFCMILISKHYPQKKWSKFELSHAQDRAIFHSSTYIIPVRLDSTDVDGISAVVGYIDLRHNTLDRTVELIAEKIQKARLKSPRLSEFI